MSDSPKRDLTGRDRLGKVIVDRCSSYDPSHLRKSLTECIARADIHLENAHVLLKPNLVMGKAPELAVNTHPEFIRALVEILQENGCDISIGDSPGFESTERALKATGIAALIDHYRLKVAPFRSKIQVASQGLSPYKEFVLAEDPRKYDIVINLPKLKSHAMMGMTLGVKNIFGFIYSVEKAKWHLRAGKDPMIFAAVLIDIYNIVRPSLTILDGILGMDGDGPTHGRPRNFGIIAVCKSAYALDEEIEKLIGIPHPLPLSTLARDAGYTGPYEAVYLSRPVVTEFLMPATMETDWAIPKTMKDILRNLFIKKPKLRKSACRGCAVCFDICPAGAITFENNRPAFEYKKCIRCYCCQEMCPEGAIVVSR